MRALFVLPLVATAAAAQSQVPTRTLSKPDAEYAEPFSQIVSLRELKDGRVLVSDQRDKTVQAVNLAAGKATKIGREGSGPQEWAAPGRFLPFTADSVLMTDGRNGRFLVIDPDGKAARSFNPTADAATSSGSGSGVTTSGGGTFVRGGAGGSLGGQSPLQATAVDARGRFYFRGLGITFNAGNFTSSDTLALMRTDLAGKQVDTLAWIRQAAIAQAPAASGGGYSFSRVVPPFQAGDEWVVFPDGRIAIARVADYHIDMIAPDGKRTAGAPVAYTPVRVAEADKEQWRRERRGTAAAVSFGGGGGGAPSTTQNITVPEPSSWPETKSAFQLGAAFAAPNGETWVVRSRSASDPTPVADVFDTQGRHTARVAMPPRTKLVGFGAKSVYLVRTDDDDLQYLQRYALPW